MSGSSAELQVVHLDDWVVVVDKPPGLVVHPAPGHHGETLVERLSSVVAGGGSERPGVVHRLDKDTSGLLVLARDEATHRDLANQVRRRAVARQYLALVEGRVSSRRGTIDAPVGRDFRTPVRMTVGGRAARAARTHFRVLELLRDDTFLEVDLETGRTHQIRTHFAAVDHPVAGDPRYGHAGRHGLKRQFLHAHLLRFQHPRSGERLELRSELPADLATALARARRA